jgi:hypothetical protein
MAKSKKSPAQVRVDMIRTRRLGLGSALAELQSRFETPASREVFLEWRRSPLSLLFVDVLRELAISPPPAYMDTEEIATQYGVSAGIGLAASICDDPSSVYPALFTGAALSPGELPATDYGSDPLADLTAGATTRGGE